jgi:hypothetical protein
MLYLVSLDYVIPTAINVALEMLSSSSLVINIFMILALIIVASVTYNRDPVDNPTPKKIPPFYTKNPYFRSIISKQLVVRITYLF